MTTVVRDLERTAHIPPAPEIPRGLFRRIGRTVRFILSHRLYTPKYVVIGCRFIWFRITHPHIRTKGFVFIERGAEIYARRGYGRLTIGRWCWIGKGNAIRCHEGNLTIGDKVVFGRKNTINCYLDIEIGDDCIFADWIYMCDFDHRFEDLSMPIRKQGIVKSPVRVGNDCWIGEKASILRGVTIGDGSIVASHALVNRDVPPRSIAGGVPARVLKRRGYEPQRGR
ncbi:MAG: DapH/DapD/GlmU-related protein [Actinomycetota bacterium]|nr:acyltransferase [Actinomycetota bacterium]